MKSVGGGGAVSIVHTVSEKKDTDRFDGNVYPSALLELLHKLADSSVNLVPLFLKKGGKCYRKQK